MNTMINTIITEKPKVNKKSKVEVLKVFKTLQSEDWQYEYNYKYENQKEKFKRSKYEIKLWSTEFFNFINSENKSLGLVVKDYTWFLCLDIDKNSQYHPEKDFRKFKDIVDLAKSLFGSNYKIINSSESGGIHIWFFFSELIQSDVLAAYFKSVFEMFRFKVASGQLETFPNVRSSGTSKFQGIRFFGNQMSNQKLLNFNWETGEVEKEELTIEKRNEIIGCYWDQNNLKSFKQLNHLSDRQRSDIGCFFRNSLLNVQNKKEIKNSFDENGAKLISILVEERNNIKSFSLEATLSECEIIKNRKDYTDFNLGVIDHLKVGHPILDETWDTSLKGFMEQTKIFCAIGFTDYGQTQKMIATLVRFAIIFRKTGMGILHWVKKMILDMPNVETFCKHIFELDELIIGWIKVSVNNYYPNEKDISIFPNWEKSILKLRKELAKEYTVPKKEIEEKTKEQNNKNKTKEERTRNTNKFIEILEHYNVVGVSCKTKTEFVKLLADQLKVCTKTIRRFAKKLFTFDIIETIFDKFTKKENENKKDNDDKDNGGNVKPENKPDKDPNNNGGIEVEEKCPKQNEVESVDNSGNIEESEKCPKSEQDYVSDEKIPVKETYRLWEGENKYINNKYINNNILPIVLKIFDTYGEVFNKDQSLNYFSHSLIFFNRNFVLKFEKEVCESFSFDYGGGYMFVNDKNLISDFIKLLSSRDGFYKGKVLNTQSSNSITVKLSNGNLISAQSLNSVGIGDVNVVFVEKENKYYCWQESFGNVRKKDVNNFRKNKTLQVSVLYYLFKLCFNQLLDDQKLLRKGGDKKRVDVLSKVGFNGSDIATGSLLGFRNIGSNQKDWLVMVMNIENQLKYFNSKTGDSGNYDFNVFILNNQPIATYAVYLGHDSYGFRNPLIITYDALTATTTNNGGSALTFHGTKPPDYSYYESGSYVVLVENNNYTNFHKPSFTSTRTTQLLSSSYNDPTDFEVEGFQTYEHSGNYNFKQDLILEYDDKFFYCINGNIVSSNILRYEKFEESSQGTIGWSDLYKIIYDEPTIDNGYVGSFNTISSNFGGLNYFSSISTMNYDYKNVQLLNFQVKNINFISKYDYQITGVFNYDYDITEIYAPNINVSMDTSDIYEYDNDAFVYHKTITDSFSKNGVFDLEQDRILYVTDNCVFYSKIKNNFTFSDYCNIVKNTDDPPLSIVRSSTLRSTFLNNSSSRHSYTARVPFLNWGEGSIYNEHSNDYMYTKLEVESCDHYAVEFLQYRGNNLDGFTVEDKNRRIYWKSNTVYNKTNFFIKKTTNEEVSTLEINNDKSFLFRFNNLLIEDVGDFSNLNISNYWCGNNNLDVLYSNWVKRYYSEINYLIGSSFQFYTNLGDAYPRQNFVTETYTPESYDIFWEWLTEIPVTIVSYDTITDPYNASINVLQGKIDSVVTAIEDTSAFLFDYKIPSVINLKVEEKYSKDNVFCLTRNYPSRNTWVFPTVYSWKIIELFMNLNSQFYKHTNYVDDTFFIALDYFNSEKLTKDTKLNYVDCYQLVGENFIRLSNKNVYTEDKQPISKMTNSLEENNNYDSFPFISFYPKL